MFYTLKNIFAGVNMAKEKTAAPKADDFDKILDGLEKQFGDGNIFNGEDALLKDKRIMLSAPRLSWAYGGSFKLNAIHRLNGAESSGKTTLATYLAAECQRAKYEETKDWSNCHVVVLDNERTFDISHAKDLGLHVTNPETGKPLLHVCRNLYVDDQEVAYEKMVVSGKVCCCIYDSDAAGIDKASFGEVGNDDISKATFGSGAKASGTVIKRMNYFVDRYSTPVVWISQERTNMTPMSHLNAVTGGMAVNFYPSTRFRVSAREPITRNGEMVGIKIKIKNYKNKTGIPNRECLLDLYFHDGPDYKAGIDGEGQYLDMALELGLVTQHGAWYYYRENDPNPENLVKCQGWGGLQTWFKENKDEFEKIKIEIDAKMSCYDETLDKNSVEVDEAEAIKQEAIETAKRKAANTEKLAEEAIANSGEGSSETPAEAATE